MPAVAYDPYDATQTAFLSALAKGEVGNAANGYTLGTGGTDLSGAETDQFGFPLWNGTGGSHAAGEFQFQPGTWDAVAAPNNLNFANPTDQNAGAWDLAQSTYTSKTGGRDLMSDLQAGNYSYVNDALSGQWPSTLGNASAPGGLSATLASGGGATLSGVNTGAQSSGGSSGGSSASSGSGGVLGWLLGNGLVRVSLIVVGVVILLIALWFLLSDAKVVPSPGQTVKAVGKGASKAALAAAAV